MSNEYLGFHIILDDALPPNVVELTGRKEIDYVQQIRELTAERDKYRDALAEHTSWKPDVGIIPPIPMSHGTCCCCGKCGRDHDECVCTHNEIEQFLARQVKAELEGIEGSEIEVVDE